MAFLTNIIEYYYKSFRFNFLQCTLILITIFGEAVTARKKVNKRISIVVCKNSIFNFFCKINMAYK